MSEFIGSKLDSNMIYSLFDSKNITPTFKVDEKMSPLSPFNRANTLENNDFSAVGSYMGALISPITLFSPVPVDNVFNFFSEPFTLNINKEAIGKNTAPSMENISEGKSVMKIGDYGTTVGMLQERLSKLGYPVNRNNTFDIQTENALKKFQKDNCVEQTGQLGKTTLAALNSAEKPSFWNTGTTGKILAKAAERVAKTKNTVGWCYSGVATALYKVYGGIVYGESAYMAANQLSKNSKFKEVKVKASDLPKLPAGAVVVWGKTADSPHGHISVALGNGKEASDHISAQHTNLRGYTNCRVFLPCA
ncbi:MAG: peptidoglycan-binding domain-containing protein [Candidatus Sericytochromatia bacterium]